MHLGRWNKIILDEDDIQFIRSNWQKKTNKELADALGLKLTKLRGFLSEMGLRRMELEYWTEPQINFLKAHYKEYGDTELAEIFEVKWHKKKGWTKKHIEKKRRYLKLKRTAVQKKQIQIRNTKMGRFSMCAKKRWETTGVAPEGEKRVWFHSDNTPLVVIKTNHGWVHYNRWLWEKHFGAIPEGMNVRINSDERINFTKEDLILVTNAENSALNSKNRLPPEARETKKILNKLTKAITKNT